MSPKQFQRSSSSSQSSVSSSSSPSSSSASSNSAGGKFCKRSTISVIICGLIFAIIGLVLFLGQSFSRYSREANELDRFDSITKTTSYIRKRAEQDEEKRLRRKGMLGLANRNGFSEDEDDKLDDDGNDAIVQRRATVIGNNKKNDPLQDYGAGDDSILKQDPDLMRIAAEAARNHRQREQQNDYTGDDRDDEGNSDKKNIQVNNTRRLFARSSNITNSPGDNKIISAGTTKPNERCRNKRGAGAHSDVMLPRTGVDSLPRNNTTRPPATTTAEPYDDLADGVHPLTFRHVAQRRSQMMNTQTTVPADVPSSCVDDIIGHSLAVATTTAPSSTKQNDDDDDDGEKPEPTIDPAIVAHATSNWQRDSEWSFGNRGVNNALATKRPIAVALRQFREASFAQMTRDISAAPCLLLMTHMRNCHIWNETLLGCVCRLGAKQVRRIMPPRCLRSTFWTATMEPLIANKATASCEKGAAGALPWYRLRRGSIYDAQTAVSKNNSTQQPGGKPPSSSRYSSSYVPPSRRTIAPFPPPRTCYRFMVGGPQCIHYPISFALSERNYVKEFPRHKAWDFMPIIPSHHPSAAKHTVDITDEDFFSELYAASYFGWTHRRGGFECLRSHDILQNGAVPYFIDIHDAPEHSLGNFPKTLLKKVLKLPGVTHLAFRDGDNEFVNARPLPGRVQFKSPGRIDFEKFNFTAYYEIADEMLAYARKYMSAAAVVSYMLKMVKIEEPKRVLIISRPRSYDYLELSIMSGLTDLGIPYTVVAIPRPQLWQQRPPAARRRPKRRPSSAGTNTTSTATTASSSAFVTRGEGPSQRISNMSTTSTTTTTSQPAATTTRMMMVEEEAGDDENDDDDSRLAAELGAVDRERRDYLITHPTPKVNALGFGFLHRMTHDTLEHPIIAGYDLDLNPVNQTLVKRIQNNEFDLAIVALVPGHMDYLDHIVSSGTPIAFLDYRDMFGDPDDIVMKYCHLGPVFIREMSDRTCGYTRGQRRAVKKALDVENTKKTTKSKAQRERASSSSSSSVGGDNKKNDQAATGGGGGGGVVDKLYGMFKAFMADGVATAGAAGGNVDDSRKPTGEPRQGVVENRKNPNDNPPTNNPTTTRATSSPPAHVVKQRGRRNIDDDDDSDDSQRGPPQPPKRRGFFDLAKLRAERRMQRQQMQSGNRKAEQPDEEGQKRNSGRENVLRPNPAMEAIRRMRELQGKQP